MIGPLPLSLESGYEGIVPQDLLAESHLSQAWIPNHQVAADHGHLNYKNPIAVLLIPCALVLRRVIVPPFLAIHSDPGARVPVLVRIKDPFLNPAGEFRHVDH